MSKRLFLFACLFWLGIGLSYAQSVSISGRVLDADDGQPVIGATVVIVQTGQGTITNIDGNFTVTVPNAGAMLRFSFMGYETVELPAQNGMTVRLRPDDQMLEEVMVLAYGMSARRGSFTGSATQVDAEAIDRRQVSNITKALDGLIPGVQVTSGTGQPGSPSNIFIRGLGSINAANTPLMVVDGIPFDGNIADISPNDIESITVLKDASAGALFGARGANGVVLITTRRGQSGVPVVNLRANWGFASRAIPRYETMDSRQFIETNFHAFRNRAIFTSGVHPDLAGARAIWEMTEGPLRIFGNNEEYNPFNFNLAELIDPVTGRVRPDAQLLWNDDWLDFVTRNGALRQEYTLDLSGGNEYTQYFLSFGLLDHQGLLANTRFQRYSGRTSIQSQPRDWLNLSLSSNFARSESNFLGIDGTGSSNVWFSTELMGPIFPLWIRDREDGGALVLDEFDERQFDYGPNRPDGAQTNFNAVAGLFDDSWSTVRNAVSARGRVAIGDRPVGWTRGLLLSLSLGVDYHGHNTLAFFNPFHGNAESVGGRVQKNHTTMMSYTTTQMLSYNFRIDDLHNFDVMVAHEFYEVTWDRVGVNRTGFPAAGLVQPDAATTTAGASGSFDVYRINSFLGRLNYNFNNRYYFSGSFRRDASSRFYRDFRWGNFWSLGANWRISEENFMVGTRHWLDNWSVRASYGVQGNDMLMTGDNPNLYAWQTLYNLAWSNANQPGAMVTVLGNPELTWERNANLNIGTDFSIFNNRLQATVEYYRRHTHDLLLSYPMPVSTGFASFLRNSGSMLNQGVELTLRGSIIRTRDFNWNATAMVSTLNNRVLTLTEDGRDIITSTRIIREGEAFQSWYLTRSAGVDPLTGQQLFWAHVDAQGNEVDPFITANRTLATGSRHIVGNGFADVFGSLSTDLRFRQFDFSVATNFSIGGKMIDNTYNSLMSFDRASQAKHVNLLRAWQQPGDITDIARPVIGQNPVWTDDMLISRSFFQIRNITLGYTLDRSVAQRLGIGELRVFTTVDNLHTFTALKGINPTFSTIGGSDFAYTPERMLSFGLNVRF